MDKTAIGVDRRLIRGELYGAIEIGERAVKSAPVAKSNSAIGIGDGLLPGVEFAALDQIGAGHDGIVGSTGCTGLEVVVGVHGIGAEEDQNHGKDDAGHVVPPSARG